MPYFIIDKEKTMKLHNALQDEIFNHCEDFEIFPEDFDEGKEHCSKCEFNLICQISNEITFRIANNRW